MTRASPDGFAAGARDSLPILVAVLPFGALFGAIVAQHGMAPTDALVASLTMFAGASQMVMIDLFGQDVPGWLIVLSVFAVNFRHVLYSAAIAPTLRAFAPARRPVAFHLLMDPLFALTARRQAEGRPGSFSWYLGVGLTTYVVWALVTWIGATFGALIEEPAAFGFDMILPIYFLALVMGFRGTAGWATVVACSAVATVVAFHVWPGPPWHVSLGGLAGIAAAAVRPPGAPAPSPPEPDRPEG